MPRNKTDIGESYLKSIPAKEGSLKPSINASANFESRLYRNVYVLSWTMGVMLLFFGWQGYLPLYVGALGANPVEVGLFFTITTFAHALSGIPLSRISDRSGRKKFVVAGTLLMGFAYMSYYLFGTWVLLMIPMFIQQLLHAAYINPMTALLSESAPPNRRGRANGLFQTIAGAISIIAPVLAAYIIVDNSRIGTMMPYLFLMTGAVVVGMGFARWAMLRETLTLAPIPPLHKGKLQEDLSRTGSIPSSDDQLLADGGELKSHTMLGLYAYITIGSLLLATINYFMVVYNSEVIGLGSMELGIWMAVGAGIFTAAQIPAGRLADGRHRKGLLLASMLMYGIAITVYLNSADLIGVLMSTIPLSIANAITFNVEFTMLAAYTSSRNRSTAFSLQTAIFDLTATPGPLIGGLLYGIGSHQFPFMLALVLTIPGFLVGLLFVHDPKNGKRLPLT
jgi:AAHS family 3-hydroxyphenylpropionic acid transporter